MRIKKYILLCLVLTWLSTSGQVDSIVPPLSHFDQEVMEKNIKEVRYKKTLPKLLPKKPKERKKEKKEERRPTRDLSFLNEGVFSAMQYLLFGAVLILIIYFMVRYLNLKYGDKEQNTTSLPADEDEIEDIEDVEPDMEIRVAMEAQDYRKACRMMFIKVLQHLNATEQIKWKKEKTNRHYLREMSGSEKVTIFQELTLDYERVWYGDRPMDINAIQRYADLACNFVTINIPSHVDG